LLDPDQYIASLARKRVAATAFFRDEQGRVLIVNPVYKPAWDLPGGAVEADESPHAACRREVAEELGLDRSPGRVLAVDWVPARGIGPTNAALPDGLIIVFDGRTAAGTAHRRLSAGVQDGNGRNPGQRQPGNLTPAGHAPAAP